MPGVRTGRDLAITIDTRNDLLFTMSDNTYLSPASREAPRVHHAMKHELFSTDEPDPDWWSQTGSNRRPPACKAGALPAELWPLTQWRNSCWSARRRVSGWACQPKLAESSPGFALRALPGNPRSLSRA